EYRYIIDQRCGKWAYERRDLWWRSLVYAGKREFMRTQESIAVDYARAYQAGEDPAGEVAQAITQRHYAWITTAWGDKRPSAEQFAGLGQMYVDDPRFTQNYDKHGDGTAAFIRDAMKAYAEANLA